MGFGYEEKTANYCTYHQVILNIFTSYTSKPLFAVFHEFDFHKLHYERGRFRSPAYKDVPTTISEWTFETPGTFCTTSMMLSKSSLLCVSLVVPVG